MMEDELKITPTDSTFTFVNVKVVPYLINLQFVTFLTFKNSLDFLFSLQITFSIWRKTFVYLVKNER